MAFKFIVKHRADLAFEISPHRRNIFSPNKHHPDITVTGRLSTKGFGGGWPMSSLVHARFSGFGRRPGLGTKNLYDKVVLDPETERVHLTDPDKPMVIKQLPVNRMGSVVCTSFAGRHPQDHMVLGFESADNFKTRSFKMRCDFVVPSDIASSLGTTSSPSCAVSLEGKTP